MATVAQKHKNKNTEDKGLSLVNNIKSYLETQNAKIM